MMALFCLLQFMVVLSEASTGVKPKQYKRQRRIQGHKMCFSGIFLQPVTKWSFTATCPLIILVSAFDFGFVFKIRSYLLFLFQPSGFIFLPLSQPPCV